MFDRFDSIPTSDGLRVEPPPHCPSVVSLTHADNNETQGILRWDDPFSGSRITTNIC